MIKLFCDACQKEITDTTEMGNFEIQEKTFGFIKHQKQDQIRTRKYIFCGECAKSIQRYFQDLKNIDGNKK